MTWPTPSELGQYLQRDIVAADPVAQLALDLAKGAVQADTGQTIELVENDAITLDGNDRDLLLLPQIPVVDVNSVTFKATKTATAETLILDTDYYWTGSGILRRLPYGITWGTLHAGASVNYEHGYTQIPAAVRAVVLSVAARLHANPDGSLQAESIGNYSYTRVVASPESTSGILTEAERTLLDPYRALVLVP